MLSLGDHRIFVYADSNNHNTFHYNLVKKYYGIVILI